MPAYRVVLVSPQTDGNIGAVARSMGNFDLNELYMVNPCQITDEAYKRAKHAGDILREAKIVSSMEEAICDCDLVVGTSGIITEGQRHFVRIPMEPMEFAEKAKDHEGRIALVFGPEDLGLSQEQLERCDILVHIPAYEGYPILNLSHAATIVFYEVFQVDNKPYKPTPASEHEKEMLFQYFDRLLEAESYPEFRREKTEVMFRRLMGRAVPTKWEYYTIMGVIGDAAKQLEKSKKEKDQ